jgi:flagellum-specific ATP synthase
MSALRRELAERIHGARYGERLGRIVSFNGLVIEAIGPDAELG